MAQFDVHANGLGGEASGAPYLLLLQSDTLHELATQVVAPLRPLEEIGRTIPRLHPILIVSDTRYALSTGELAGISRRSLGPFVTNVDAQRDEILAAIDLLFFGI